MNCEIFFHFAYAVVTLFCSLDCIVASIMQRLYRLSSNFVKDTGRLLDHGLSLSTGTEVWYGQIQLVEIGETMTSDSEGYQTMKIRQ